MNEETTIKALKNSTKGACVCKHLAKDTKGVGFNVPEDIYQDRQAWCNECEEALNKVGEWTDDLFRKANFCGFCGDCFNRTRNYHISKLISSKI